MRPVSRPGVFDGLDSGHNDPRGEAPETEEGTTWETTRRGGGRLATCVGVCSELLFGSRGLCKANVPALQVATAEASGYAGVESKGAAEIGAVDSGKLRDKEEV